MAFAALVSLKNTIANPTNELKLSRNEQQALDSWCSILKTLDKSRNRRIDMSAIDAIEAEIKEGAYKLEDMIQSYELYRSLPPSDSLAHPQLPRLDLADLQKAAKSFCQRVMRLEWRYKSVLRNPLPEVEEKAGDGDVSPTQDFGGNESTTVGLSDQIEKITNELLDLQSGPKIVSLVGMAGIGKTHVAREIARHPQIVKRFKFIACVSVGSKREKKDIVVDIVAQILGEPRNLYEGKNTYDLSVLLRKSLCGGGRYLIVLDDVWSIKVASYLMKFLPDNREGRRFLLTTRLEEVAKVDSNGIRKIRFMNNEESWNLLRQKVFAESYCPSQLEKVGRKIAEKCDGLPLLILAVARILCRHERTEEFWKAVAEDEKNPTFTNAYEEISEVLYPSYDYLPLYLKACFLYMAVFPQRYVITLPKLIHLWIAEDFFEGDTHGQKHEDPHIYLENLTMESLETLVSNSVVIICKHSSTLRIKSCKLHSAFWHLCAGEARKTKLFHVLKRLMHTSGDDIESQRRLSVQNNILFGIKEAYESMAATSTARSLLCTGPDHEYEVPICFNLVLLKVLDAAAIRFYEFPIEVVKLVRLKYLALTHHGEIPSSISILQQLQCLIVRHHHSIRFVRGVDSVPLPKEMRDEIRDVPEVRSIKLLEDSTSLAKEIWEMICYIQQVQASEAFSHPAGRKELWMEFWRLATGETQVWRSSMKQPRSIKLLRDSTRFPKEILGQIWEKIWDMQEAWSTKLGRDSIGLLKEIWVEMWEIQDVTISDSTFLPKETWEMQQLRHLRIIGRNLPDPIHGTTLPNLSTLFLNAHSCTYSVFNSLPCLKKLGIEIELGPFADETISCFKHIGVLERLESLKCVVVNPRQVVAPGDQLSNLPRTLKKLSLSGLGYGWECISAIGSLPNLEVLKLRCAAFRGLEWGTNVIQWHEWEKIINGWRGLPNRDDKFRSLKYLLLEDIDLVRWTITDTDCFPRLERLIIRHCYKLKELYRPRALKMIEVVDCSPYVVAFAERERARSSSSVEVVITSSWKLPR